MNTKKIFAYGTAAALVLEIFSIAAVAPVFAQSADASAPSIPQNISASVAHYDSVNVSWSASTDNVGVAGYYIYRNGSLVGNINATSYTDAVSPGASYSYTVSAYDAAGNVSPQSASSAPVSIVRDSTPPTVPTITSVTAGTSTITLSWQASSDSGSGLNGYGIYKNGVQMTNGYINSTSYTDTGLSPGNTYKYSVVAYDYAGNSSTNATSATTLFDVTPPSVPSDIRAYARSYDEIDVTWSASTDNVGVAGYYVYRNGSQVANVSSSVISYDDTKLSPSESCEYSIAAYDAAGNVSQASTGVTVSTLPPDTSPPSAPQYFTAKAASSNEVDLSWSASSDNYGVAGYYLSQGVATGTNSIAWSATTTLSSSSLSYVYTGLATSTEYYYSLEAYDAAGNTSPAATAQAVTLANSPAAPADSSGTTDNADAQGSNTNSNAGDNATETTGGATANTATTATGSATTEELQKELTQLMSLLLQLLQQASAQGLLTPGELSSALQTVSR